MNTCDEVISLLDKPGQAAFSFMVNLERTIEARQSTGQGVASCLRKVKRDSSRALERDNYKQRETAWARKAEYPNWRCPCLEISLHGEAEVFFETGLCGYLLRCLNGRQIGDGGIMSIPCDAEFPALDIILHRTPPRKHFAAAFYWIEYLAAWQTGATRTPLAALYR